MGPTPFDVYLICPDCGCLVIRRGVHDRWHSDHAGVVDRVAYAIFHVGPPFAPAMSWDQARRMAAAAVKALGDDGATTP